MATMRNTYPGYTFEQWKVFVFSFNNGVQPIQFLTGNMLFYCKRHQMRTYLLNGSIELEASFSLYHRVPLVRECLVERDSATS